MAKVCTRVVPSILQYGGPNTLSTFAPSFQAANICNNMQTSSPQFTVRQDDSQQQMVSSSYKFDVDKESDFNYSFRKPCPSKLFKQKGPKSIKSWGPQSNEKPENVQCQPNIQNVREEPRNVQLAREEPERVQEKPQNFHHLQDEPRYHHYGQGKPQNVKSVLETMQDLYLESKKPTISHKQSVPEHPRLPANSRFSEGAQGQHSERLTRIGKIQTGVCKACSSQSSQQGNYSGNTPNFVSTALHRNGSTESQKGILLSKQPTSNASSSIVGVPLTNGGGDTWLSGPPNLRCLPMAPALPNQGDMAVQLNLGKGDFTRSNYTRRPGLLGAHLPIHDPLLRIPNAYVGPISRFNYPEYSRSLSAGTLYPVAEPSGRGDGVSCSARTIVRPLSSSPTYPVDFNLRLLALRQGLAEAHNAAQQLLAPPIIKPQPSLFIFGAAQPETFEQISAKSLATIRPQPSFKFVFNAKKQLAPQTLPLVPSQSVSEPFPQPSIVPERKSPFRRQGCLVERNDVVHEMSGSSGVGPPISGEMAGTSKEKIANNPFDGKPKLIACRPLIYFPPRLLSPSSLDNPVELLAVRSREDERFDEQLVRSMSTEPITAFKQHSNSFTMASIEDVLKLLGTRNLAEELPKPSSTLPTPAIKQPRNPYSCLPLVSPSPPSVEYAPIDDVLKLLSARSLAEELPMLSSTLSTTAGEEHEKNPTICLGVVPSPSVPGSLLPPSVEYSLGLDTADYQPEELPACSTSAPASQQRADLQRTSRKKSFRKMVKNKLETGTPQDSTRAREIEEIKKNFANLAVKFKF